MTYYQEDFHMDDYNMNFLGGATDMEAYGFGLEAEEDDILAGFDNATLLASETLIPDIQIQPPSRADTRVISSGTTNMHKAEHQPWNPLGIDIPNRRAFAQQDVAVSTTPASSLPSDDGTSVTSIMDSVFASPHACEQCGTVYKNNSNKRKHILTHTKPHKCPFENCNKNVLGFATQNDLDRHKACVHGKGLKKWWKCAYPGCSKNNKHFDRRDNFVAHIKRRHGNVTAAEIYDLVARSEQKPTKREVQDSLIAKKEKSMRGSSIVRSARRSSPKAVARRSSAGPRRQTRVKSEASSVGSPAATTAEPMRMVSEVASSAPVGITIPGRRRQPFQDGLALAGPGIDMSDHAWNLDHPQSEFVLQSDSGGKEPSLNTRAGPYYPYARQDSFVASSDATRMAEPSTLQQVSMFHSLPPTQYLERRIFASAISRQRNVQAAREDVLMYNNTMQGQDLQQPNSRQANVSVSDDTIMPFAFCNPSGSDMTFSQSYDPSVDPSGNMYSESLFSKSASQSSVTSGPSCQSSYVQSQPQSFMKGFGQLVAPSLDQFNSQSGQFGSLSENFEAMDSDPMSSFNTLWENDHFDEG
ncbi:hypothetical protein AAFC00_006224 [Neodothiora populina]|uniref:C2H2-type domain-containing protein n=1 Tax=Neodothiora populina TaxID=2781224 RepID=A0ABR3P4H3_9PEZI